MAFCASCGASLNEGATFCVACGSQRGAAGSGPVAASPAASVGMEPNVAGLLTYVLGALTGIIFLVLEPYKNDRFVRFHAFQSIFFTVAWIVFWIAWSIVWGILGAVTGGVLGLVSLPLGLLVSLAGLACWIFLMYKAYKGERYMLPYIGDLSAKQAG